MKLAILFGSNSNEHEVSIVSASSIIEVLDKQKYDITPIYLDKHNRFYKWLELVDNIKTMPIGEKPNKLLEIENIIQYLKTFDLVFLMVHGKNGEDGVLASIFDFFKIKYIGHDVLSSTVSMDKILAKQILEYHDIKVAPYLCFYKYQKGYVYLDQVISFNEVMEEIDHKLNYPLFVKPSRSGSSVGISKVENKKDLKKALIKALKVDNRLLIEEMVEGQELECGLLETHNKVIASSIGEVLASDKFYSYKAKYQDKNSQTIIPADINEEIKKDIQNTAIKIFKILNLHGFSRCDFFLTSDFEIVFNEINTIPGFTSISMYPRLFENINIDFKKLLDIIIEEAK